MQLKFIKPFFLSTLSCFFAISLFGIEPPGTSVIADDLSNSNFINALANTEGPTVVNSSFFAGEETSESEKILVVLLDSYGIQTYSKIVITDVDMELSILIAKDLFAKLPGGIYTVIASSANDLISQKLIIL